MAIIYFFLFINLLIAIHECGHFIFAKLFHVRVIRFSLGFGKSLLKFYDHSGTEYSICSIPFGGYVKLDEEHFQNISLSQKTFIVIAGPFFNFLFAWFALWMVMMIGIQGAVPFIGHVRQDSIAWNAGLRADQKIIRIDQETVHTWSDVNHSLIDHLGESRPVMILSQSLQNKQMRSHALLLEHWSFNANKQKILSSLGITPKTPMAQPIIARVILKSPAAKAGIKSGDRVLAVNGRAVLSFEQIKSMISEYPHRLAELSVLRNGKALDISLMPNDGQIGVQSASAEWPHNYLYQQKYSFFEALLPAAEQTFSMTRISLHLMIEMVKGSFSWRNINGPISIAKGLAISASNGLVELLKFLAFISVSLGIVNLLPIPVLDGGYLVYHAAEYLLKKPLPHKVRITSMIIGWGLVGCLIVIALINDLTQFLT